MILLLDTHTLIWLVSAPDRLPASTLETIQSLGHRVYVSTVSFWEIAIKFGAGRLDLKGLTPEDLPARVEAEGYEILSPDPAVVTSSHRLPRLGHKDPFDRMLVWQAIRGGLTLVSADSELPLYEPHGLRLLW